MNEALVFESNLHFSFLFLISTKSVCPASVSSAHFALEIELSSPAAWLSRPWRHCSQFLGMLAGHCSTAGEVRNVVFRHCHCGVVALFIMSRRQSWIPFPSK